MLFVRAKSFRDCAIRNAVADGLWLEFGVFKGYSANYLALRAPGKVHGFDSFAVWPRTGQASGHEGDVRPLRPVAARSIECLIGARIIPDTLPAFLATNPAPISLLHLDCDTYGATAEVLGLIRERLTSESIVIFDDYHGFWGFRDGQFKAWAEFVAAERLSYEYAAFSRRAVMVQDLQPIQDKQNPCIRTEAE